MRDTNKAHRAAQARTLPRAIARGEEWTAEELEMVQTFADASAEELALALGRTVYGVQSIRQALAQGHRTGPAERRSTPAQRAQVGWAPDDPRWG